ncbi:MAG: ATP-binding cassette domain-containing protein [Ruminococcaceae bacterium]|nr:ATP-binding cassette domain-containing protein [Oscillospiraceae bacterium]
MIEINNLVRKFGNKYALDGVSFTVKKGEIVGFLGPNGAGKSTTMNIITGYLSPSAGTVLVDGIDVFTQPKAVKSKIGFLPEQPPLYVDMTVWEYLSFVFDLKSCTFNKKAHLNEICELVKIADVKKRLIKNLSKGYKQRVGIASAIIGNPEIIIFDEPTVGLDPKQIIEVRNLLRSLGKDHTVILSTHILTEVQAICDRIVIINEGKIIADQKTSQLNQTLGQNNRFRVKIAGPNREVLNLLRGIHSVTRVTQDGVRDGDAFNYIIEYSGAVDIRKMLFTALASRGWPILAMEGVEITLEDLFVKLIDEKGDNQ